MKKEIVISIVSLLVLCIVCGVASANAETRISTDVEPLLTRGCCAELLCEYIGNEVSSQSDAIATVTAYGLMYGYPDDEFHPEFTMNRVEFVASMARLANCYEAIVVRNDTRFIDVPEIQWASGLIHYFDDIGIFADIEVAFEPERPITLAEAKLWLGRLAESNR